MRYVMAVLAASFGLAASTAAEAQNASSTLAMSPAQTEAHKAASDELSAVVVPDQMTEGQVDRLVEGLLVQMFAQSENLRQLEAAYPGMKDAVGAGMKPLMIDVYLKMMPLLRADLAALYRANLTTGEARTAKNFLRSPVFAEFSESALANINFKAITGALLAERDVTAAEFGSDLASAEAKTGKALSPADRATLMAFFASPVGLKLTSLNPQKLAIEAKWANYSDPESDKAIELAVIHAMVSHIALTDPETAAAMREELTKEAK
jgi:hypothetical protein